VLPDSLKLEIDEGDGFERWTRVDDFFSSGENDTHYLLNATTGEVRLGGLRIDGALHGHVPVANVRSPGTNIVAREYRFGGGTRGNVPSGMVKTLVTPVDGIDDGQVTNRFDAFGGRDEESLEDARVRASRSLRSRDRAVTTEDFEQLAQEAANVKRAKALPLYHPNFPGTEIPGVVSVIIVPDSEADQPTPSDGTMRVVCAYLDKRRLLTAEVFVLRPTYQHVEVRGDIIVHDDADLGEVKQKVEDGLTSYFHPLKGGDEGRGWPFGGTIFYSKVVNRVFQVSGVSRIQELDIYLDGERKEKCEDVELKPYALLYSTDHHLDVHYSFLEEAV
jgi:predicted phage baseplate assembly protein